MSYGIASGSLQPAIAFGFWGKQKFFSLFERRIINPLGGFYGLDDLGRPTAPAYAEGEKPARYLFATSRIVPTSAR
jgi:hypothetical protein